jgi:hypothetical protein
MSVCIQISNFMKIPSLWAELPHADRMTDGRTDRQTDRQTRMKNLIFAFRNFAKAPKNWRKPLMMKIYVILKVENVLRINILIIKEI